MVDKKKIAEANSRVRSGGGATAAHGKKFSGLYI